MTFALRDGMKPYFGLILLLCGCVTPDLFPRDRLLATIPDGAKASDFKFSRDGRVVAYILKRGGEYRVVWKGQEGKSYDAL